MPDPINTQRRGFIRSALSIGATLCLGACASGASTSSEQRASTRMKNTSGRGVLVRWLGGGVVEIATPDYKQIAFLDAWIWTNKGYSRFSNPKPPEYASKEAFIRYVTTKQPEAVFVLLSHDHSDHMGDYFEMLKGLQEAHLPVKTTGQSDLLRQGLHDYFIKAALDPKLIISNEGSGMNFGGESMHGAMCAYLVPAQHSNASGYPAAGFMLDIGGIRLYLSGDTDLFGDMKLLGERYKPDAAIICVGGGPYTMGPEDAALACAWFGVKEAIPIHYGHNDLVKGIHGGDEFRQAAHQRAPDLKVKVLTPGDTATLGI